MVLRVLLLIALTFFIASVSWAEFTLSSGVGMRLEYNDNIFLDNDDEAEDDFIASISPHFSIGWNHPNLKLSLKVGLIAEKYLDHTEEDDINPDLTQPTELDFLVNLYKDVFFLSVKNVFSQTMIDEGGRGGEGNRKVNLTNTNRLQINPYLQFAIAKNTQLKLGYTYENLWYKDDDGNDSESHTYSTVLTQGLSPRVTMSLRGSYKLYRPKNPDQVVILGEGGRYDYNEKSVSVGLTYQATEKLFLQGSYGHTWLDYDVKGKGDTDIWSAGADFEITSNYSVGTSYTKSVDISVDDGTNKNNSYKAYLEYDDRFLINFTLFSTVTKYVEIDRETDSYGGMLSGELPFNNKVGLRGLLSYTNFDETGFDPEEYDRYSALMALYYEIRLGRISAGYTYTENDYTRNSEDDYTNNIVFLEASLSF